MPQGKKQKYNPVTRKFEWVMDGQPLDKKRSALPKNPEHAQITSWLRQFDATVGKPQRVNPDYAFLIRKQNGVDVTSAVLNEAKTAGLVDDKGYRSRLKRYQDIRAETAKMPMLTSDNKPATYVDSTSGKERPLLRSYWINDGNYDFSQSFSDVANRQNRKREGLATEQKSLTKPWETAVAYDDIRKQASSVFNKKLASDTAIGTYKAGANALFDIVGAAENTLQPTGSSLSDWTSSGQRIDPNTFNMGRAAVVNAFDPDQTPEEAAQKVANTVGGNVDPRNVGQAAGMQMLNFGQGYGAAVGGTLAAQALGPQVGLPVAVMNGLSLVGQVAGAGLEYLTGDARFNALGNPLGAARKQAGAFGAASEQSMQMSGMMAPATSPLLVAAGLIASVVTKKPAMGAGSYKDNLKSAINNVRAISASAAAKSTVNQLTTGAKGMGLAVEAAPKLGMRDALTNMSPFAIDAASNLAVPALQTGYAIADPENNPMPNPADVISAGAGMLMPYAKPNSLVGKMNKWQSGFARDAEIKYAIGAQRKEKLNDLFTKAPVLQHLTRNYGLTSEQALAYVSQELDQLVPGAYFPGSVEGTAAVINQLPTAKKYAQVQDTGNFQPVVDQEVMNALGAGRNLAIERVLSETDQSKADQIQRGRDAGFLRGPDPATIYEQINPRLRDYTKIGSDILAQKVLLQVRKTPSPTPITGESASNQMETNQRSIPMASMVIDTDTGPKKVYYSHNLDDVFVSDDLRIPASELNPDTFELKTGTLPRENLIRGIRKMNQRQYSQVEWSHQTPDGAIIKYAYVGFGNGRIVVDKSNNNVHTILELTPRELDQTIPASKKEQVTNMISELATEFGTSVAEDGEGTAVNYTRTDFRSADRDLFPSLIFAGKSTRGFRGALPARKIDTDNAFNTYQLPNGAVIRRSLATDTAENKAAPVMPPIDARMETVIGSRYANNLYTQARANNHPHYYDVTMPEGNEVRIFVTAKQQKTIKQISDDTAAKLSLVETSGEDRAFILNDANSEILQRLLFINRTGKPSDATVTYNKYHNEQPIMEGDVVQFTDYVDEDNKTRASTLARAGHDKGVVVKIDKDGVHVKLANELPGLIEGEGGRTVLVHPDNLSPLVQPRLNAEGNSMIPIKSVADIESYYAKQRGEVTEDPTLNTSGEASTEGLDVVTETPRVPVDAEANERLYGPERGAVVNRLREEGTVEHVRKLVLDVSADKIVTAEALSDGLVNILNDDNVSVTHKESIIHAMLSMDLDPIKDLNQLSKLNHALSGVSDWLTSEKRIINLIDDASTLLSGDFVGTETTPKQAHEHAMRILHNWNTRNVENAIKQYLRNNPDIDNDTRAYLSSHTVALSMVIPKLRTFLNGRGLVNGDAWKRVAKLTPAQQGLLFEAMQKLSGKGLDTKKSTSPYTMADVVNAMAYANIDASRGRLPTAKNTTRASYEAMVKSEIAAFKKSISESGVALSVQEINKPNGQGNIADVNAFLKTLDGQSASAMRDLIFKELASQDIDQATFQTLFTNIRFPGSKITVAEIADHVRNRTLGQFVDASNDMHASVMMLQDLENATLENLTDLIYPFEQLVPEDVYREMVKHVQDAYDIYTGPKAEKATPDEKRRGFVESLNLAVTLGLRNLKTNFSPAEGFSNEAKKLFNTISNRAMRSLELSTARAEAIARAQEATGGSKKPIIRIDQATSSELKSRVFDLTVDNVLPKTLPEGMTKEEAASILTSHEESNAWLSEQGQPAAVDVPVTFPFSDIPLSGAQTPSSDPYSVEGTLASNKEGLVVAFRKAMNVSTDAPAEVKAVVDQLAKAYADAYDLHTYAYAARHAEYEFSVGHVQDANDQILQTLEAFRQVQRDPDLIAGLDSLIEKVKNGEPLFIKNKSGRSARSVIDEAFPKNADYAQKLSTYIYTSRIATLQRDFYTNNGRLVVTASPANVGQGQLFDSFGSLTFGTLNSAGERASVNLLLHLNRTTNRSRDILSLGHELHHGLFHTMPLTSKLLYAKNVLDAVAKAQGLDSVSPTNKEGAQADLVNAREQLNKEIEMLSKKKKSLQDLINEDPYNADLQSAYDKLIFETEIDMHADTSHVLYTNPIINELVVSSLVTGSMGMKPIYDGVNFGIAYTTGGVFNKMGAFINQAVQLMNRSGNKSFAPDYTVKGSNQGVIASGHNWKLRFNNSFVVTDANGKPKAYGRLPKDSVVSFITNNRAGLPTFPLFKEMNGKLVKLDSTALPTSMESVPPGVSKKGTESHAMSVRTNYVHLKPGSSSELLLIKKNVQPAFTLDGKNYYALDEHDGIFVDRINNRQIRSKDIAGVTYGLVNASSKTTQQIAIVTPDQLFAMRNARISGTTPGWNSTLSALMYDMYARNNVIQITGMGQADYATYNALKTRVAKVGLNLDAMPSVNMSSFDKNQTEYALTAEGAAGRMNDAIDASESMQKSARVARNQFHDYLETLSVDNKDAVQKDIINTIDGLRRTIFSLDVDDNPLMVKFVDKNGESKDQYSSSLLTSEEGNTNALTDMFHVGRSGDATPVIRVVKDVASAVLGLPTDVQTKFAKAILNSPTADKFEALLTNEQDGLGETGSSVLRVIEDAIDKHSVTGEIGLDDVLYSLRSLTAGATDPLYADGGINVDVLKKQFGRIQSKNSEWTPNHSAQRDFVLSALEGAAKLNNMSIIQLVDNISRSPAGQHAASFLSVANSMAMDVGNRSAAMRSYGQWELAGVKYNSSKKAPFLIMRNKGVENRLSQAIPDNELNTAYVAIDQDTGAVRPAVPVVTNGVIEGWTIIRNAMDPSSGLGGAFDRSRFPQSVPKKVNAVNWSMVDDANNGNLTKDSIVVDDWLDSDLFAATANVNASGLFQVKRMVEKGMVDLNKQNGTQSFEATLPLYIATGSSPTQRFDASLKPKNMVQLFEMTNDYANGSPVPDGNLQMRHVKISVEYKAGKHIVTFTDYGSVQSADVNRRTLGPSHGLPGLPIAPFETYVARKLLSIEAVKDLRKESNFFNTYDENGNASANFEPKAGQDPLSRQDVKETDEGKRSLQAANSWKEWKGNSLFSDGYDADDFAYDVSKPMNESQETLDQDSEPTDVLVTLDKTLGDDEIAVDVDKDGVIQTRGGMNKKGWHVVGTAVSHAVSEFDGFWRTLKLSGDLSVASNQSWFTSNFLVGAEHYFWAKKYGQGLHPDLKRGPLFSALGAWKTMLPNAPGQLYGMMKGKGKNTRFGDNAAHVHVQNMLERVPTLSLEMMSHYGLNLEYLKWYREYSEALGNDPDVMKTDIPLNLRLSDYYGDSKYAQKLFPGVSQMERFNALWKDIAAITEFQKRYLETEAMLTPEYTIQGIQQFKSKQLHDSAEAINLLQGMQRGSVSPNKYLSFAQRTLHTAFTSLSYRRSRLLLTPIVGRLIYGSKLAANAVSNKFFDKDIANVSLEKRIFADTTEGGFSPEVKQFLKRRIIMGYAASRALQAFGSAAAITTALAAMFGQDQKKKKQAMTFATDFLFGNVMTIDVGDKSYNAPMPGGMSSGIKQLDQLKSTTPTSMEKLPNWAWKQYIENQLGPTIQVAKTGTTGKTFAGDNAWESDPDYKIWRNEIVNNFSWVPGIENLPPALSRFATSMLPIGFTDQLKDINLKRQHKVAAGDPNQTLENIPADYFKQLINVFGAGLTNRDDKYSDWITDNVPGTSISRYEAIKRRKEKAPSQNISEVISDKGLGGVIFGTEKE